jgi:hypothetical protein
MHLLRQMFLILFGGICAFGLNVQSATAQSQSTIAAPERTDAPEPSEQSWHVDVAPYLWFPGIYGTVGTLDHEGSVHVPVLDILSNRGN